MFRIKNDVWMDETNSYSYQTFQYPSKTYPIRKINDTFKYLDHFIKCKST